jgi:hypothetical protein
VVLNALIEARETLRNIKGPDVVSVGLCGDNLDERGALVRISFLAECRRVNWPSELAE